MLYNNGNQLFFFITENMHMYGVRADTGSIDFASNSDEFVLLQKEKEKRKTSSICNATEKNGMDGLSIPELSRLSYFRRRLSEWMEAGS